MTTRKSDEAGKFIPAETYAVIQFVLKHPELHLAAELLTDSVMRTKLEGRRQAYGAMTLQDLAVMEKYYWTNRHQAQTLLIQYVDLVMKHWSELDKFEGEVTISDVDTGDLIIPPEGEGDPLPLSEVGAVIENYNDLRESQLHIQAIQEAIEKYVPASVAPKGKGITERAESEVSRRLKDRADLITAYIKLVGVDGNPEITPTVLAKATRISKFDATTNLKDPMFLVELMNELTKRANQAKTDSKKALYSDAISHVHRLLSSVKVRRANSAADRHALLEVDRKRDKKTYRADDDAYYEPREDSENSF